MLSAWADIHDYMYVRHTCTVEFYSYVKKNEKMASTGKWMDLENIMLSEMSQAQEGMLSAVYPVWNFKGGKKMEVRDGEVGEGLIRDMEGEGGQGREGIIERCSFKALFKVVYMYGWKCHKETHYFV